MRLRPYRTVNNVIDGVVITFENITERMQYEQTLEESEARYRMLVENSPYCIHEIDLEGRFTSINAAGLRMLGDETEDSIKGTPYLNMVSEGDKKNISDLLRSAFEGQLSEFEFEAENGHFFQSSFIPITNSENTVLRLMGFTQDISKRKQAESNQHIQSGLLKYFLDSQPIPVAMKDTNLTYAKANKAFCDFFNKPEEEIIGKTDLDLFPRGYAEKNLKIEAEMAQNGHQHSVVEEINGALSKQRFRITRVPVYDETTKKNTKILVTMCEMPDEQP